MKPVEVYSGDSPIVLGFPHTGIDIPETVYERLTPVGKTLGDTDWHVHVLYDGLLASATTVRATFHRYVIDANRDPSGASLYPDRNTTGLVPITDFDGEPLWINPPGEEEIKRRRASFHTVYHTALEGELQRVRDKHGFAILYDCHSIRSKSSFLFEGTLPDFNIGTNGGTTCAPEIERAVERICEGAKGFSSVTNGRFKGGWTTRHYGRPEENIHAIQMELAQSTYLESEAPPFSFDARKASALRIHLKAILETLADLAPTLGHAT